MQAQKIKKSACILRLNAVLYTHLQQQQQAIKKHLQNALS